MLKKILLTYLVLLGCGSYAIANPGSTHHNHTSADHKPLEIPSGQPLPSVDLKVHKDTKKGWNLEAKVVNFKFAPESVNQANKPGEGHAHLYINGKKITRIYSSWYYLENLSPGKNKITISLNANNHSPLAFQGTLIEDTEIIDVSGKK